MFLDNVEAIIKKSGGSKTGYVETDKDWEILRDLFILWAGAYPDEAQQFKDDVTLLQSENISSKGIVRGTGGSMVQHQLEIPGRWWKLVRVIFPLQKMDDKFVRSLSKQFSIFTVSGAKL